MGCEKRKSSDVETFSLSGIGNLVNGRKKRLAELRRVSREARFGSVQPITGSDFIREVSQAPPDVWVVVHLYKDG